MSEVYVSPLEELLDQPHDLDYELGQLVTRNLLNHEATGSVMDYGPSWPENGEDADEDEDSKEGTEEPKPDAPVLIPPGEPQDPGRE